MQVNPSNNYGYLNNSTLNVTEAERNSARNQAMKSDGGDMIYQTEIEQSYAKLRADNVNQKLKANNLTTNKAMLNQQDFLKLLMKELQYQDPLEPMDNKEFIGQMAQFSNLQQTSEISEQIKNLSSIIDGSQAFYVLGKEVAYINPNEALADGEQHKPRVGVVEAVTFDGTNGATLKVGNDKISIYDVVQVYADNKNVNENID